MVGMSGISPCRRRTDVAELRRLRRPHSADVLPHVTVPAALRRRNTAETPSPQDKETCRLRRANSHVLPTFNFTETGRLRGYHSANVFGTASPAAAREGERQSRRPRRSGVFFLALAGALVVLLILWSAPSNRPEPGPEHDAPSTWEAIDSRRTQGVHLPPATRLGSPHQSPRRDAEGGTEDGAGPGAGEAAQEADADYDYGQEEDNDYDYGQENNDYDYSDYDYGHE